MSVNPQITMIAPSSPSGGGPAYLIRRYAVWTLLVTILVTAGALGAAQLITPTYLSQAKVVVEPRVSANTTPLEPDMGTEKQVAQSGVVLSTAARELGITAEELSDDLTVGVSPDTHVLEFSYSHPNAQPAQRRVYEVAVSYVNYRNSDVTTGSVRRTLQATLVTNATLPVRPEGRPIAVYAGAGALAGLVLGVLTAFVRDRLDDGLRGTEDVERHAGMAVLTNIPLPRAVTSYGGDDRPAVVREPDSAVAGAFRQLRTRLQTMAGRRGGATLLIASPAEQDGRTTTAVNLAAALAMSGANVVLVNEGARLGTSESTPKAPLLETTVPGLRVLKAEPSGYERMDMPEPVRLGQYLADLRKHADYVVVDSGPMSRTTDAMAFASVVDLVVVVVDIRRTTRTALASAVRELRACEGSPAGAVVNVTPRGRRSRTPNHDPCSGLFEPAVVSHANSTPVL